MNVTVHANEGKIFVLTDKGRQISRIKAKYTIGSHCYRETYQRVAPKAWLDNGWITQKDRRQVTWEANSMS